MKKIAIDLAKNVLIVSKAFLGFSSFIYVLGEMYFFTDDRALLARLFICFHLLLIYPIVVNTQKRIAVSQTVFNISDIFFLVTILLIAVSIVIIGRPTATDTVKFDSQIVLSLVLCCIIYILKFVCSRLLLSQPDYTCQEGVIYTQEDQTEILYALILGIFMFVLFLLTFFIFNKVGFS